MKKLTKKIAAKLITSAGRFTTAGRFFEFNDAVGYYGFSIEEAERMQEIYRTSIDANDTKKEAVDILVEKYNDASYVA